MKWRYSILLLSAPGGFCPPVTDFEEINTNPDAPVDVATVHS
jgi:hypothetical protein